MIHSTQPVGTVKKVFSLSTENTLNFKLFRSNGEEECVTVFAR